MTTERTLIIPITMPPAELLGAVSDNDDAPDATRTLWDCVCTAARAAVCLLRDGLGQIGGRKTIPCPDCGGSGWAT